MYRRLAAWKVLWSWTRTNDDSSSPGRVMPVVRCASSQIIRSNAGAPTLLGMREDVDGLVRREDDRDAPSLAERSATSGPRGVATFVVVGSARSRAGMSSDLRPQSPSCPSRRRIGARVRDASESTRAASATAGDGRDEEQHAAGPSLRAELLGDGGT